MPGEVETTFSQDRKETLACALKEVECTDVPGDPAVDVFACAEFGIAIPRKSQNSQKDAGGKRLAGIAIDGIRVFYINKSDKELLAGSIVVSRQRAQAVVPVPVGKAKALIGARIITLAPTLQP